MLRPARDGSGTKSDGIPRLRREARRAERSGEVAGGTGGECSGRVERRDELPRRRSSGGRRPRRSTPPRPRRSPWRPPPAAGLQDPGNAAAAAAARRGGGWVGLFGERARRKRRERRQWRRGREAGAAVLAAGLLPMANRAVRGRQLISASHAQRTPLGPTAADSAAPAAEQLPFQERSPELSSAQRGEAHLRANPDWAQIS